MKSYLMWFLVVFLTTTSLITAQNNLSYRLKIGDQFTVYQLASQDIVQDMNGSKHEIKNKIEGDYTFVIEGVSDSLYDIRFKFDRFKMTASSNLVGEIMSINTTDSISDDDIEGKIFSQLVTTDLSMKMYKNGKIKSIEGSKALIDNMINAAGDFDEFTKELMRESMKKEFSNKSLAQSFEQMTYIYPSEIIKKGESWTNAFEGELAAKNTWTLNNITEDDIIITGKSTIIFKNSDSDVEMNLTGDMTSSITTSLENGFVKHMSSKSVATGNSIMHNMNDTKVPTTITSNITYKIEKHVQ
ncbi:hypothetical protein A9Q86_04520 [Flavobacteriales bacterium 33_180_T64]|nr:hypothetical protein A9Q86_04520 [Flavobacteriales bacterium 33_180_T64]